MKAHVVWAKYPRNVEYASNPENAGDNQLKSFKAFHKIHVGNAKSEFSEREAYPSSSFVKYERHYLCRYTLLQCESRLCILER